MLYIMNVNAKEFESFDKTKNENIFHVITDINGKKYLICHGDKNMKMIYNNYSFYTPDEVYDRAVKKGLIESSDDLTICCCYGGLMNKPSNKNITMLNKECNILYIHRVRTKKGGKLVCYTKNNFINRLCAAVAAI